MPQSTAFLSDIHGNSPALRAVLADIQRAGCSEVFILGDIINGVDPHGCIQQLRAWEIETGAKIACIQGNAEAYLMTPDRISLPKQDEALNQGLIPLVQWFDDHLTQSDLDWIRSFPDTLRWHQAYLVHDSPADRLAVQTGADPEIKPQHREWFYHGRGISPEMPEPEWETLLGFMAQEAVSQLFCGHTHVPFVREFDGRLVCNTGSAGAPLDGDLRPSWVLLETAPSGQPVISIRRVEYEISRIHQLIDAVPDYPDFQAPGMRKAYKAWLATGIHWRVHLAKEAAPSRIP